MINRYLDIIRSNNKQMMQILPACLESKSGPLHRVLTLLLALVGVYPQYRAVRWVVKSPVILNMK